MGMKFRCDDGRVGIPLSNRASLSARRRAAIEDFGTRAHEQGDELRCFVLDRNPPSTEWFCMCQITAIYSRSARQQFAVEKNNASFFERSFVGAIRNANGCDWNTLIVAADFAGCFKPVFC